MSHVSDIPCAAPQDIERRYAERLAFETDCWDVHEAMRTNTGQFSATLQAGYFILAVRAHGLAAGPMA